MTTAELIFAFTWLMAPHSNIPVAAGDPEVFPENLLPGDEELPGLDVLICTADPRKEPILEVMNTVLSAMALDYPNDKLSVYLSDDAGAALTLYAMKEACSFASSWIPFCRKYTIKTRCPEAYFSPLADDERFVWSDEFKAEEISIKALYELFKKNVENAGLDDSAVHDRLSCVEVIHDNRKNGENKNYQSNMPLLVYVAASSFWDNE